jgi:hypothetical protein
MIVNEFRTQAVPAVGCAYRSVSVPDTSVWIGRPTLKGLRPSRSGAGRHFAATGTAMPGIFTFTAPRWLRLVM